MLALVTIAYRPITLKELISLVEIPKDIADDLESVREIINLCGSFLTIQEDTVYFIHQSAKGFLLKNVSREIFPSGTEGVHFIIFSRSLELMSRTLQRDIYGLRAPGFPIEKVRQPDPDPLEIARYPCVYWVDHLSESACVLSTQQGNALQDGGLVDTFLRKKYVYWLEALSLLRSMSEGALSMAKLEALIEVRFSCYLLLGIFLISLSEKGKCVQVGQPHPRCTPVHLIPQVANREQPSPGVCFGICVQSGP
jgi:hypothetical protein